jgi:hypothetical protein
MGKELGTIAEIKFIAKALQYKLRVSVPVGDNSPYDAISDHQGHICKVQIKSTLHKLTSGRNDCYKVNAAKGRGCKKKYKSENVDVLAVYIHALDCWYIIPFNAVEAVSVRLYPHRKEVDGRYEQYKERWEILFKDSA